MNSVLGRSKTEALGLLDLALQQLDIDLDLNGHHVPPRSTRVGCSQNLACLDGRERRIARPGCALDLVCSQPCQLSGEVESREPEGSRDSPLTSLGVGFSAEWRARRSGSTAALRLQAAGRP